MRLRKKVLSVVLVCLIILIGSGAVYCFSILRGISGDRLDADQLHINQKLDKDVSNIAVFGLDGRDDITVTAQTPSCWSLSITKQAMSRLPPHAGLNGQNSRGKGEQRRLRKG